MNESLKKTMENLEKNGICTEYVATKAEVKEAVKAHLFDGCTIGVGGSVTLDETGVLELLRRPEYVFFDRYAPGMTAEEKTKAFRDTLSADVFLCSSNAVTEKGELYNVDGTGNRVAAIAYGPAKVVMVVGINKIVPDLKSAEKRVKTVAAKLNCDRLNCDTYCHETGHCMGLDGEMGDGCRSDQRICCQYLVSAKQRLAGRIHVIFVGESCGY